MWNSLVILAMAAALAPGFVPRIAHGIAQGAETGSLKVLITSFDPFGGSSVNQSRLVARELVRRAFAKNGKLILRGCDLPTVYDGPEKRADECIERFHPGWVVSLGEAACDLRIETAANNRDDTPGVPDNAGVIRTGLEIIPGAPARQGFVFPVAAMDCVVRDQKWDGVVVSKSPGNFVCNHVAYALSRALIQRGIPFTFIHVPNSRCASERKDPGKLASRIEMMLQFAALHWNDERSDGPLPTNREEAEAYLSLLKKRGAPDCEIHFAEDLRALYF